MGQRLDLDAILRTILGTTNVYFQPPEDIVMEFPCFIYHRDFAETEFADNEAYNSTLRYMVTYVDSDPDTADIVKQVLELPMCTYDRFYTADKLNHDVFKIFF